MRIIIISKIFNINCIKDFCIYFSLLNRVPFLYYLNTITYNVMICYYISVNIFSMFFRINNCSTTTSVFCSNPNCGIEHLFVFLNYIFICCHSSSPILFLLLNDLYLYSFLDIHLNQIPLVDSLEQFLF